MKSVWRQLLYALLFSISIGMCLMCYMLRNYSYKIVHAKFREEGHSADKGKLMNWPQVHYKSLLSEKKRYNLSSLVHGKEKEQGVSNNMRNFDVFSEKKMKAVEYQHKQIKQYGKPSPDQNHDVILEEEYPYYTTSQEKDPKTGLYIFSLSYMDQLSWATTRWRSLQCWASQMSQRYSVHVIEPFVTDGTHLGVPAPVNQSLNETLKFSDIFDIEVWHKSVSNGLFPFNIISWDAFLSSGARNVVTVQIVYPYHYHCTENEKTDTMCKIKRMQTLFSQHLSLKDFTLIKSICINFREVNILTLEQFNRMIFDSIPQDLPITVMFDEWRGLAERSCFVRVRSKTCQSVYDDSFIGVTLNLMRPSLKVDNAARKYIHRFIHQYGPYQHGYAAIVIRWEKILNYDFYHNKSQHYSGSHCVRKIMKYLKEEVYKKRHIQSCFLTTDIGKYGSSAFNLYNSTRVSTPLLTKYTEKLLRILHNNETLHLSEYEERFEKITGTTSPAFIS